MINFPPLILTPYNSVFLKGGRLWAKSLLFIKKPCKLQYGPVKEIIVYSVLGVPKSSSYCKRSTSCGPALSAHWGTLSPSCQGKGNAVVISKIQSHLKALLEWSVGLLMVSFNSFLYAAFPINWKVGLKTWQGGMKHVEGRILHRRALLPMVHTPGAQDVRFSHWERCLV